MTCTLYVLSAATIAIWYDMSLHIFGSRYPRDHPITILSRFATVTINCFLSVILVYLLFHWVQPSYTMLMTLEKVGLAVTADNAYLIASSALVGVGCTCLLYLGELLLLLLSGELGKVFTLDHWRSSVTSLQAWRDIVVGPVSEEVVFRGCLIAMLSHGCHGSLTFSILVSSLLFGVAHLHHIVELLFFQRESLSSALQSVGFQIGYSTVFGLYASFIFAKTGHLVGPILAHSLCNWLGIPRLVVVEHEINQADSTSYLFHVYNFLFNVAKRCLIFVYVLGLLLFMIALSYVPLKYSNE